ncbi:unnamed protein product [Bursaphelenchus okinawaensis]|uniref:Uncharacterized protein n=1 Tax=Bursaphelenchus okinawaensis TaxID=465554 RepID=A0A811LRR3_9BILA|nr:unnamed protein product [Bursaphelenchus okinawaensis]CAG9127711.1 unnamed protein product [Bursaphelenchus okinawaensis]
MKFVLVLALICVGFAQGFFFDEYPAAKALIPSDIADFIHKLRPDEVAIIKAANARHPGNIKAIIKDIEHTSPALAIKATPIARKYQKIVQSFTPAGRKFSDELLKSISLAAISPSDSKVQTTAQSLLTKWNALDKTTQAQLNAKFPNALSGLQKLAKEGPTSFRARAAAAPRKPVSNPIPQRKFLKDAPKKAAKPAARAAPNVRPQSTVSQG